MTKNLRVWAPLPLRLMLGFGFMYHGGPKLFSAQGHEGFVGMLTGIGVPAPGFMAWLVGVLEFFGGLALIVGLFASLVAIPLIINMLVAWFKVHMAHGFNFINITGMTSAGASFGMPGYEVNLLYIAGLVALILSGAGKLSLDDLIGGKRRGA